MQNAAAARNREELGAEADQAASGDQVLHPHPSGRVIDHLLESTLATGEHLRDVADVLLGNVDRQPLDQLQLATPLYLPSVGALGVVDPQRDVADQLGIEAGADLTRGQFVPA